MPKIIKKTVKKKIDTKKKGSLTKTSKSVPAKSKKVVKSTKVVKTHKTEEALKTPKPVKTKKISVDVIADDNFLADENIKDTLAVFSTWPNLEESKDDVNNFESNDLDSDEATTENQAEVSEDPEYDKQKKFFSEWANSVAPQAGEETTKVAPGKSLGLYRRMAIKFIIATAILALFIFYFFFSKLTVAITPQSEPINDSFTFTVGASDSAPLDQDTPSQKKIIGEVKEITVTAEQKFQTSGQEAVGAETISGQVTIINKYNNAQPLVAKTRLLSPDGKLFRISESVNVPAGGSVVVDIYADKPDSDSALTANTHFTIPGLWAGLQDKIYAENKQAFIYQTEMKYSVQQADLDKARRVINDVLNSNAKNEIENVSQNNISVYGDVVNSLTNEFDAKLGADKAQFTAKASKKIVIIVFSKDAIANMAKARLALLVPDDKQLSDFDGKQITYSLDEYDVDTKTASVKAYFGASMFLKSDSSLLDRKKMVGLNRKQLSQYLDNFPEIKSYELKFSPSFINNAPNLPDKIKVVVENVD